MDLVHHTYKRNLFGKELHRLIFSFKEKAFSNTVALLLLLTIAKARPSALKHLSLGAIQMLLPLKCQRPVSSHAHLRSR